jgi:AcrR family transcriptional regulator
MNDVQLLFWTVFNKSAIAPAMGRRSDHSRDELRTLFVEESARQMAEMGFPAFSARSAAKAIGYSVGTVYNVFGSLDGLLIAVNTRTFRLWTQHVEDALAKAEPDRIAALVRAYFSFAESNPKLWMAIYDHRLPPGTTLSDEDHEERGRLTELVCREVAAELGRPLDAQVAELTRSLIATVHGHCSLALVGSWAIMGGGDPVARAIDRVRESLAAHRTA